VKIASTSCLFTSCRANDRIHTFHGVERRRRKHHPPPKEKEDAPLLPREERWMRPPSDGLGGGAGGGGGGTRRRFSVRHRRRRLRASDRHHRRRSSRLLQSERGEIAVGWGCSGRSRSRKRVLRLEIVAFTASLRRFQDVPRQGLGTARDESVSAAVNFRLAWRVAPPPNGGGVRRRRLRLGPQYDVARAALARTDGRTDVRGKTKRLARSR